MRASITNNTKSEALSQHHPHYVLTLARSPQPIWNSLNCSVFAYFLFCRTLFEHLGPIAQMHLSLLPLPSAPLLLIFVSQHSMRRMRLRQSSPQSNLHSHATSATNPCIGLPTELCIYMNMRLFMHVIQNNSH